MPITSERVEFAGAGGEMLAARLELPAGEPAAFALFAHCFTCSKDVFAASRISAALAERGIAALRFDFTGLGASGGDFANTNFSSNVEDLVAAADFLRARYSAPALLIGHSLGGAAVLAAAGRVPEAVGVVTLNAPAGPEHVRRLLRDSVETIEREGEAEVAIAGRTFRIRKQFLDDLAGQAMEERIGALGKALLVMNAPADEVVSVDNAGRIYQAARHPKSFIALDGADHLLTRREDAAYVAAMIVAWASPYAGPAPEAETAEAAAGAAPRPGEVIVTATGEGRFAQAIAAGPHTLRADEPRAHGGDDRGPDPYSLLMASLGACTNITLRMYADRKGWPLGKVSVRLKHGKIHAEDCAACETETGRIDRFEREISLEGDLSGEQTARLLEIAERCPVHRTLHSETVVETRLAGP